MVGRIGRKGPSSSQTKRGGASGPPVKQSRLREEGSRRNWQVKIFKTPEKWAIVADISCDKGSGVANLRAEFSLRTLVSFFPAPAATSRGRGQVCIAALVIFPTWAVPQSSLVREEFGWQLIACLAVVRMQYAAGRYGDVSCVPREVFSV